MRTIVAGNHDLVDGSLRTLKYADLEIDGVTVNRYFGRIRLKEQVAVVHVQRTYIAAILTKAEPIFQQLLIVDLSFGDIEHIFEYRSLIDRITLPVDIPEIILSAFIDIHTQHQMAVFLTPDTIAHDTRIAVALRIIVLDDCLLVLVIFFLIKLRTCKQPAALFSIFHFLAQPTVRHIVITHKFKPVNFDSGSLIDIKQQAYRIYTAGVQNFLHIDCHIKIPLFDKILLNTFGSILLNIFCYDTTAKNILIDLLIEILVISLFGPLITMAREARPFLDDHFQKDYITDDIFLHDIHLGKQAETPEIAHSAGDIVARDANFLSHLEARHTNERVGIAKESTTDLNSPDFIVFRLAVGNYLQAIAARLCSESNNSEQQCATQKK